MSVYLEVLGTSRQSNNVIYERGFEPHGISSNLGGARDWSQPCGQLTLSRWRSANRNSGHHVSSEHPWLAILCAYCHTIFLGKLPLCMTLLGEHARKLHMWTLLDSAHASLPLTDFNLYPFTVKNPNQQYKCFQWVLWGLFSKLPKPRMVLLI